MSRFSENISRNLQEKGVSSPASASAKELYEAVSRAAMAELAETWHAPKQKKRRKALFVPSITIKQPVKHRSFYCNIRHAAKSGKEKDFYWSLEFWFWNFEG